MVKLSKYDVEECPECDTLSFNWDEDYDESTYDDNGMVFAIWTEKWKCEICGYTETFRCKE